MAHTQDMILLAEPYRSSYVHFSEAKPEDRHTAVVFVHGLFGDSVSTWWRFQTLVDEDAASKDFWSHCDLYFYRYNSFGHHVSELSEQLRGFLNVIFPSPSREVFELAVLPEIRQILAPNVPFDEPTLPGNYESLFLVGHSLGGVVIRQALVDFATIWKIRASERSRAERYLKATVRLFSPAIRGFQPTGIKGFLYHYAASHPTVGAVSESLTSLQELKKDSQRLSDLQRDTERFATEYDWMTALGADLLYASTDIVYPGRYQCDLPESTEPHQDHESICKPHSKYQEPLWFVQRGVDYKRGSFARPR
jgi:pimeloyl-ACP methyl ester carboxylesterase